METHSWEGVVKEEEFSNTRKPSQPAGLWGVLESEGNITRRGKKQNPQITRLTATPSGEVAQMLVSTTSKPGLNREAWAALLRVSSCPEGNLRELTR